MLDYNPKAAPLETAPTIFNALSVSHHKRRRINEFKVGKLPVCAIIFPSWIVARKAGRRPLIFCKSIFFYNNLRFVQVSWLASRRSRTFLKNTFTLMRRYATVLQGVGDGYFDVRDHNDAWICVWLKKGAMIVLPAGIYHRFTLDSDNYIKEDRQIEIQVGASSLFAPVSSETKGGKATTG